MTIEEIFGKAEGGTLTLEQFESIAKEGKAKFVDLSVGEYVSKKKYEDEISTKDGQIEDLNTTISQRDTDLNALQEQLEKAGGDTTQISNQLKDLQAKYETDMKSYQDKLASKEREFAVKEHASSKKFTSEAARRDYINLALSSEDVKFNKKGELTGLSDFDETYATNNADAFKAEETPKNDPAPTPTPMFTAPTQSNQVSKPSLTDMMRTKNENPDAVINF